MVFSWGRGSAAEGPSRCPFSLRSTAESPAVLTVWKLISIKVMERRSNKNILTVLNYLILHWVWNQLTVDTGDIVILRGIFSSHGTSTRSWMAHAGTGSGVLNSRARHTFNLLFSVLKGNLENLPGPVCWQCRGLPLIRQRCVCIWVHVWVVLIIYGKDCFPNRPVQISPFSSQGRKQANVFV